MRIFKLMVYFFVVAMSAGIVGFIGTAALVNAIGLVTDEATMVAVCNSPVTRIIATFLGAGMGWLWSSVICKPLIKLLKL